MANIVDVDDAEKFKIEEVQRQLRQKLQENDDLFDPRDVEKIVDNEEYVKSYLQRQRWNVEYCVAMIENALIWRNEHCLPWMTATTFPCDFYEISSLFIHGVDNEDNVVLYIRVKYALFTKEGKESIRRSSAYYMFTAYEKAISERRNGWTLFVDMSNVKIIDSDFGELLNIVKILVNYLPSGLNRIILYQVPWFAKPFSKLARAILPEEWRKLIYFADTNTINDFVCEEQLPKHITHPNEPFSTEPPSGVKRFDEMLDKDLHVIGVKAEDRIAFKALIERLKQC